MRHASASLAASAFIFGGCLALTGCTRAPVDLPPAAPVSVTVSYPVQREVTDYADFPAQTAAVDCVDVRARVWGYLKKINFKEGMLVKEGDVLFELDPRPYQAEVARCQATLVLAKAHLTRTSADLKRADELLPKNAIAQSDYDLARDDRDQAAAAVGVAQAALNIAELNLGFTKVTAPISGRISRYLVTVGNLVQSGEQSNGTLLTTIVSVDPIYAYFHVDEPTVRHVRELIREGKMKSAREAPMAVSLRLGNEDGFPHAGTIDFIDNQVNPKTGTLRLRGTFPNRDEALLPGFFGRVRVPVGALRQALLVTGRAIDNDQGQKIVYVVNDKNEVVTRHVQVGLVHDGLRVIEEGLKPNERVIVNGLQSVRQGMKVQPQLVDMPRSSPTSDHHNPGQAQLSQAR